MRPFPMGLRRYRSTFGWVPRALGVLSMVCAAPAAAQPTDPFWGSLPLPGGADAARAALALGEPAGRLQATVLLDFLRRFANVDMRAAALRFEQHLLTVEAVGDGPSASQLPLPLPGFWRETLGDGDLLGALLRHRGALSTYHGLMALDAPTLSALSVRPDLLRSIVQNTTASSAFSVFSAGLRIGPTGVDTPGGPEFGDIWQTLVGVAPSDVERFVMALMTRDAGRLAWFYDTVAGLPEPTRRFALAADADPEDRPAIVRAVYERFRSLEPTWRLDARPFYRPTFDGALLLTLTHVKADGSVGPAWWPAALDALSAERDWSLPSPTGRAVERRADVQWLFDWVFADPADAQRRFGALRFAQRIFADTPATAAADVRAAVGGALATPVLMFALERLGVRDPAVLAEVALTARSASRAGNEAQTVARLSRWQSALGLLEQVQRRVALPERRVTALVQSLTTTLQPDVPGAVAGWVVDELLGALVPERFAYAAIEDAFLRAATTPGMATPVPFTWEGLPYVVDTATVAWRSATAIRRARPGPQLQDLVELVEVHRSLTDRGRPGEVSDAIGRLKRLDAEAGKIDHREDGRLRALTRMVEGAPAARADRAAAAHVVADAIDAVTEAVVPSLLYALAAAPTTEPILYPEAWTRHSLQQPLLLPFGASRPWREVAWQFPTDYGLGGGTRLIGAFLGVDLALADAHMVRLVSSTLPVPGVIEDSMRRGVIEQLVLRPPPGAAPVRWTTAPTLTMGRRRVAAWSDAIDGARWQLLRRAGVDPWRANALMWEVEHRGTAAFEALSLRELAAIGAEGDGARAADSAWSGSSRSMDGCFCLSEVRPVTPEQLRGRRLGVQALQPLDIGLRLTELLEELGLAPTLVPSLMPLAVRDWLDRSHPAWTDDWEAYSVWPRALPVERVEEYLLFLVSTGVFSPPPPPEEAR